MGDNRSGGAGSRTSLSENSEEKQFAKQLQAPLITLGQCSNFCCMCYVLKILENSNHVSRKESAYKNLQGC